MAAPQKTFLDSLSSGDREALLAFGHQRAWSPGGVLVRTGEPAESAIVLLAGLVKIHKVARGGEEVLFAVAGAGDLFGEMSTIRAGLRSATVTALTAVEGVVLPASDLRSFFARHPSTVTALLDLALTRLYTADMQRLEFVASDSLGRVTSRLVELTERFGEQSDGGAIEVPLPLNQEELASWSGASRESTARALRALRQLGLIRTHRLHLTVLDLERLRNHAART